MRAAVVAEWYPSAADPVHGIWAHRQAQAVQALGVEVRVLALRRPVPPLSVARGLARVPPDLGALRRWGAGARRSLRPQFIDEIDVRPVAWIGPPRPISYGSWGYWMAGPLGNALNRLSADWPFDVLHAHCLAPAGHAAQRWISRRPSSGVPAFVVSAHGADMIRLPRHAVGRQASRAALRRADLVLANSTWARRRCEEIAEGPLRASVVHLGATVAPAPSEMGETPAHNGRLRIVTVAHLQARKNHDIVLRALAELDPAIRPEYLVIGDGEEREALQELTGRLHLGDRVRFLGQLRNEEAVAHVASSDLFVMPGTEEPFGVAFVEAMAAGVPAVGGRGEGGPEDIAAAGEGMLLVPPGSVEQLATLVRRLSAEPGELRRLGAAARKTAIEHFTWERCGEKTVAAYREAMAAAAQHP